MITIPKYFQQTINTVYPHYNFIEFERWFGARYLQCKTEREYLQIYWCSYQVNHNYGRNKQAMETLQTFIDTLPKNKKYFVINQYDDGVGVNWRGLDVLEFNMSKIGENKIPISLIGQEYPFELNYDRKYLANFIGKLTHPIRNTSNSLIGKDGFYISYADHLPDEYFKILNQSVFTLCYRGYGINSFRIAEAMQMGSIPVYISDEFSIPFNIDFNGYGVLIKENEVENLYDFLSNIEPSEIVKRQNNLKKYYNQYYTYEGLYNEIIKYLESET